FQIAVVLVPRPICRTQTADRIPITPELAYHVDQGCDFCSVAAHVQTSARILPPLASIRGHRRKSFKSYREAEAKGVLNLRDLVRVRNELADTRFRRIRPDSNPIRQALSGGTLGFELCISLNFDSYDFNTALRRLAVEVVAVARRHRQAQQFTAVCGRSQTRRARLNIKRMRLATGCQRYLMTLNPVVDGRADQHPRLLAAAMPPDVRDDAHHMQREAASGRCRCPTRC